MSIIEFKRILRLVRGEEASQDERDELFQEVALMVLARATSADTNMQKVEVEKVQDVLKRVTGVEISIAEIRTAASSAVFETTPLKKYLGSVSRSLDAASRMTILDCLIEVIQSDDRISHFETDYFDMVAEALKAKPSEVAGLVSV
jgi:uncharacterized tellurite resistance protein B-like protein